jgi:hypothetical protein
VKKPASLFLYFSLRIYRIRPIPPILTINYIKTWQVILGMPVEEISAPYALHAEQSYVFETASKLGLDARLVGHDIETKTCTEKAQILNWDVDRVVKALYFTLEHRTDDRSYLIGVVTPEVHRRVDPLALASYLFNPMPTSDGLQYHGKIIPKGMSNGTCTPFPRKSLMGKSQAKTSIDKLLIFDMPYLNNQLVDISVGGGTPQARKTSMHLQYGAIYDILNSQFPGFVERVEPKYI